MTLAFSQIIYAVNIKWENFTGGDQGLIGGISRPPIILFGLSINMASPFNLYFLIVVAACMSLFTLKTITDSPFGWVIRAIRDNSERTNFLSVNVKKYIII